ncbi:MAG: redox-regulated ATPase YchF [Bacilli bacterium]
MGLTAGIVGLPNVGKSTLFNSITKQNILIANYPFATIEQNVGVVVVPDKRLEFLNDLYIPKRLIGASFEFTDIAGLVEGASKGEGLGNKFLAHIREVDAICEVVRCFDNDDIIHVLDGVDPLRDVSIIDIELMLADLEVVQSRLQRIGKKKMTAEINDEVMLLTKICKGLEQNIPLRKMVFDEKEILILKPFNFLTFKPIIFIANVSEDDVFSDNNVHVKVLQEYALKEHTLVIVLCAKMEADLVDLSMDEKKLFLSDLGIASSGLEQLIKATYDLLGLATYFTVGSDEVRAWTFKKGMKAPDCAGIIHTDFKKGFIKAEVMSYDDLLLFKDGKNVKLNGKMRLEGKDYIMKDGDICNFRFNV